MDIVFFQVFSAIATGMIILIFIGAIRLKDAASEAKEKAIKLARKNGDLYDQIDDQRAKDRELQQKIGQWAKKYQTLLSDVQAEKKNIENLESENARLNALNKEAGSAIEMLNEAANDKQNRINILDDQKKEKINEIGRLENTIKHQNEVINGQKTKIEGLKVEVVKADKARANAWEKGHRQGVKDERAETRQMFAGALAKTKPARAKLLKLYERKSNELFDDLYRDHGAKAFETGIAGGATAELIATIVAGSKAHAAKDKRENA